MQSLPILGQDLGINSHLSITVASLSGTLRKHQIPVAYIFHSLRKEPSSVQPQLFNRLLG
jgi:hypothetical protein